MTTASILGGLAGFLVGGIWVGGALFAVTSYLSRRDDDDISKALKGVAKSGLEAVNFGGYLNDKYAVTTSVSSTISGAVDNAKTGSSKEAVESVTSALDGVAGAIQAVDQDVGIKDTVGGFATTASDVAFQAVDKVVSANDEYKITDQIKAKIDEVTKR